MYTILLNKSIRIVKEINKINIIHGYIFVLTIISRCFDEVCFRNIPGEFEDVWINVSAGLYLMISPCQSRRRVFFFSLDTRVRGERMCPIVIRLITVSTFLGVLPGKGEGPRYRMVLLRLRLLPICI